MTIPSFLGFCRDSPRGACCFPTILSRERSDDEARECGDIGHESRVAANERFSGWATIYQLPCRVDVMMLRVADSPAIKSPEHYHSSSPSLKPETRSYIRRGQISIEIATMTQRITMLRQLRGLPLTIRRGVATCRSLSDGKQSSIPAGGLFSVGLFADVVPDGGSHLIALHCIESAAWIRASEGRGRDRNPPALPSHRSEQGMQI